MRETTPQVYVIAATQLTLGCDAYLRAIGAIDDPNGGEDWETDAQSDGDKLVEIAGRVCYRSWMPWDERRPDCSNPNVERVREGNAPYIANCLKQGHGSVLEHVNITVVFRDVSRVFCYHPETEVFTAEGWKRITDLTIHDLLLTMDPITKLASFDRPLSLHEFDYEGYLGGWQSSQMESPMMTSDHLLWAAPYDMRCARGLSNEEISAKFSKKIALGELQGKRFVIDHAIQMVAPSMKESNYKAEVFSIGGHLYDAYQLMQWLGWMATDGGLQDNECKINQSKLQHIPELHALMDDLFVDRWRHHGPYGDSEQQFFVISDPDLARWVTRMIGPNKAERDLHVSLYSFSSRVLRGFYDSLLKGDGSVHHENGHEVIYCSSERAAGQYQVVCSLIGKSANVRLDDRSGTSRNHNGTTIHNNKPCYVVSVSQKTASLVKKEMHTEEHYKGKVYCPKTKHGLIYVRNKGLPFWCGNTHELVRHRAGMGYSQESLRYVRLHDLKVWIPPSARRFGDALVNLFVSTIVYLEGVQLKLAELTQIEAIKDFATKKALTSMFRRLAPIGLATTIVATGNARAWRHVMNMRASAAAEEEMQLIMPQLAKQLVEVAPACFQDFEIQTYPEGVKVTYPKV